MAITCLACRCSHQEVECPVCGYEVLAFAGNITPEEQREEEEHAAKYLKKLLTKVRVKLPVYSYRDKIKLENRQLQVEEPERDSIVMDGSGLQPDKPVWFPEKFCNLDCDMPLTYEISDTNGKGHSYTATFQNPQVEGETVKIGMVLRPGLKLEILIGDEKHHTGAGPYNLK
jgi:hypothetical protein